VTDKFNDAHSKWYEGLREYQEVMKTIEGYAKQAGRDYKEVVELARRGQNTADRLMDQQNAIQDDLYMMLHRMPEKG
jgi:two-component SAPR family response regulator